MLRLVQKTPVAGLERYIGGGHWGCKRCASRKPAIRSAKGPARQTAPTAAGRPYSASESVYSPRLHRSTASLTSSLSSSMTNFMS